MKTIIITMTILLVSWSCERTINEDPVFDYNKKSAEVIRTNNQFGLDRFGRIIESD